MRQLKRATFHITVSAFSDFKDGVSIPSINESLKQAPVAYYGAIYTN
jgi:hypothetical protein